MYECKLLFKLFKRFKYIEYALNQVKVQSAPTFHPQPPTPRTKTKMCMSNIVYYKKYSCYLLRLFDFNIWLLYDSKKVKNIVVSISFKSKHPLPPLPG